MMETIVKGWLYGTLRCLGTSLVVAGFVGCASPTKEDTKIVYLKRIDSLEGKLRNTRIIDDMLANDLIGAYATYAENFAGDSISPDYLFRSAEIASSIKQGERAIAILKSIHKTYPAYEKAALGLFLQAFIYETQLRKLDKAKELYQAVVDQYPHETIADDAKACIRNLGKSDEELIKEFEGKNKM